MPYALRLGFNAGDSVNHPVVQFDSSIDETPQVQDLIRRALMEDVGTGDVTTLALVPEDRLGQAVLLTRQACCVAGVAIAARVFSAVDARCQIVLNFRDGQSAAAGEILMTISGPARALLTAERTALNIVQRMTGIATLTHTFVQAVRPYSPAILDTRKTTPTLRILEKYAVSCGGGTNHRMGLYDMILIKDNHRFLWSGSAGGSLAAALQKARSVYPFIPLEIEVESLTELRDALQGNPDWVLLDNMPAALMRECVTLCKGRCRTEASGGITLARVAEVAATGVDAISIGALTHSAPAADLSLEMTL
jgi:nicotinate-nucleotide pyrophosphorylase (carboxylating)